MGANMIRLSVKFDTSGFERKLAALKKDQVPFASAVALTGTAQDAASELNMRLPDYLDNPTPFTRKAFSSSRANKRDGKAMRAIVFAKDAQAKYLQYQVFGGSRAPNKRAQRLPSNVNLNEFGNIPRGEIARLIALAKEGKRIAKARGRKLGISSKLDLFYGDPGNGNPPGIYKRVVHGDRHALVPLIVFPSQQVQYKPRFPMRDIVQRVVAQKFAPRFKAALADAIGSAR